MGGSPGLTVVLGMVGLVVMESPSLLIPGPRPSASGIMTRL